MQTYNVSRLPSMIKIGWDGENLWRPQAFDCSVLLANHPNGVITLWLLPNGETDAIPVALERDGNMAIWTPTSAELVVKMGQLQLMCVDGVAVGKSAVVYYQRSDSLVPGEASETPSWAVQMVQDVNAAASRYPKIEGGYWWVWDVTNGIWVNTMVKASGAEIDPADIADAVEDYMDEHPVEVPVQSVNGKRGAVTLGASDVGALPDDTPIPAAVTVDFALSSTSENPVQNKVVKAALDAKADKTTLLNLLIPILRQGLYGNDQEAAISALETALGGTPPVQAFAITNNLTNVTNSNEATAINSGTAYTATLTPDSGMEMQTVTVTMGGVDVTSTVYSNGTISIASVTGNIVITAVAESVIETITPTMIAGYAILPDGREYDHSSYQRTSVIPCRAGDKVYGTCENSGYPGLVVNYIRARWTAAYDSNGAAIVSAGSDEQADYSQSSPYVVPSGVYGVVFSMVNSLANNVVIYVDKSERVGA